MIWKMVSGVGPSVIYFNRRGESFSSACPFPTTRVKYEAIEEQLLLGISCECSANEPIHSKTSPFNNLLRYQVIPVMNNFAVSQ